MTRANLLLASVALLVGLQGCVRQTMYSWGAYDEALYAHYKNPQDRERFVASLDAVIRHATQTGEKVPPGCFAEFGYALMEEGRHDDAIAFFQRERDQWPESRVLMEKMIRNAQQKRATTPSTPAKGPAGAIERS
jgi:hypothetical protein